MKNVLRAVAIAILLLSFILLANTCSKSSKQLSLSDPIPPLSSDLADAAAKRLAASLRIRSISREDRVVDGDAFVELHRYLETNYPRVHESLQREIINEYSLVYRWEGHDPKANPILFSGHLDVVPVEPGTEELWPHPAYDGRIVDGYIWGRGALDDKVGVLAILEAAERLLEQGFQPAVTHYFLFGHDEENGGDAGAGKISEYLESLGVKAQYLLDEGGAIVENTVPFFERPVALIGIAEKGYVSLRLTVRAAGGHSSTPPSQSAIGILAAAIEKVEAAPLPSRISEPLRHFMRYTAPEMNFMYRMLLSNMWLFGPAITSQMAMEPASNANIRTTTAVTLISGGVKENVLPSESSAVVNFRILPGDEVDDIIEHVEGVVDDERVEITLYGDSTEPSITSPADGPEFEGLQRAVARIYPDAITAPYLTIGGTDARHYGNLTKKRYRFLPVQLDKEDLKRIHGTSERIPVMAYSKAIQFFELLLRNSS